MLISSITTGYMVNVPEPSSFALMGLGSLIMLRRRRQHRDHNVGAQAFLPHG